MNSLAASKALLGMYRDFISVLEKRLLHFSFPSVSSLKNLTVAFGRFWGFELTNQPTFTTEL